MPIALTDEQRLLAVTFMTTEQFTLQTARGVTTSETNGRAMVFLSTLSSTLVALGFVAQISSFGQSFSLFALLILPPIAFLGLITFQRAVQSGIEDELCRDGMNRIRHFYVELIPEMRPYFLASSTDASDGSTSIPRWQVFLTVASAIGVINSVVIGAIAGIAIHRIADPGFGVTTGIAIPIVAIVLIAHFLYQLREWAAFSATLARVSGTKASPSID